MDIYSVPAIYLALCLIPALRSQDPQTLYCFAAEERPKHMEKGEIVPYSYTYKETYNKGLSGMALNFLPPQHIRGTPNIFINNSDSA